MKFAETKIKVRYQETDQMGVVYHANYFVWFEVGRTEMIRNIGISYKEMEDKGLLLPVVNVSCDYKHAARYDDELLVKTRILKYNGFRMEFEYQIIHPKDNKLLATGITKHVWIDKSYKPVRIGKITPEIHKKIEGYINP